MKDVEIPLSNSKVMVCYIVPNLNAATVCSNFTLGSDNKLKFITPPLNDMPENGRIGFKVKAKWIEGSLYLGEIGILNIKADRGSLCSVSSKRYEASKFLGLGSQIDIDIIVNGFNRYFYNPRQLNCILLKNKTEDSGTTTPY
ncbi:hypothetical protein Trydic_g4072 [Trypoxylus dichotomus]